MSIININIWGQTKSKCCLLEKQKLVFPIYTTSYFYSTIFHSYTEWLWFYTQNTETQKNVHKLTPATTFKMLLTCECITKYTWAIFYNNLEGSILVLLLRDLNATPTYWAKYMLSNTWILNMFRFVSHFVLPSCREVSRDTTWQSFLIFHEENFWFMKLNQ